MNGMPYTAKILTSVKPAVIHNQLKFQLRTEFRLQDICFRKFPNLTTNNRVRHVLQEICIFGNTFFRQFLRVYSRQFICNQFNNLKSFWKSLNDSFRTGKFTRQFEFSSAISLRMSSVIRLKFVTKPFVIHPMKISSVITLETSSAIRLGVYLAFFDCIVKTFGFFLNFFAIFFSVVFLCQLLFQCLFQFFSGIPSVMLLITLSTMTQTSSQISMEMSSAIPFTFFSGFSSVHYFGIYLSILSPFLR